MLAPPSFMVTVRHALAHLYDPDVLRTHPLLGPLGLSDRANPQAALREALVEAVEGLKPPPSVPVGSRAWRIHRVLVCRYVQQLDQEQTAHQLGVGVRHVRREQHAAVEALADLLYEGCAPRAGQFAGHPGERAATLEDELAWLRTGGQGEAKLAEVLPAALELVAPLAAARGTGIETLPVPSLPSVAMHPAALRQSIVSAASCAVRRAPGGSVSFSAEEQGRQVLLKVTATARGALAAGSDDEAASLAAARTLLSMEGGRLDSAEDRSSLSLTLAVPVAGVVDVLLIDDNADFAQLFERYVSGTRYRLRCLSSADRLFDAVAEYQAEVVVLDVMIPGVGGWEILGRLRQHPLTSALPVVVCTILPERELALALGATEFVSKPVTRQGLLGALSRALGEGPPEPR